jgi:hypothetical protein
MCQAVELKSLDCDSNGWPAWGRWHDALPNKSTANQTIGSKYI